MKNNLGPAAAALAFRITDVGLTWEDGTVEGSPEQLLASDDVGTRSECRERDDAVTFLRDLLRNGPVSSKQVMADAKANGIAQRTLWRAKSELEIVAVNDITNAATLAHLLKYDSVHGNLPHAVKAEGDQIMVQGTTTRSPSLGGGGPGPASGGQRVFVGGPGR